jgi:putative ABC transport system permease protein
LRRILERRAPGSIIVADNTAEPLAEAEIDATNAKILFFLLGIPGVLVAAALGLAAASALTEAQRRDNALLRLRGASDTQLVGLEIGQGLFAGVIGVVLGLTAAVAGVSVTVGHGVWHDVHGATLVVTVLLACMAGSITTATRLVPLVRAGRTSALGIERRRMTGRWNPTWRRARLDVVALVVGFAILGGNLLAGGLKPIPIEGQALALSFYVLLAPVALWLGATLLIVRGALTALSAWSRPDRPRPLTSWTSTMVRWMGRRPARTTVALALGALAVAFGTETATFVATYSKAKQADTKAAFGADIRIGAPPERIQSLPPLGGDVLASTAIRTIPTRAGSDRKSMMAIEIDTYRSVAAAAPQIVAGRGLDALAGDGRGVLVAQELAKTFAISPGDTLPVTVFPDDRDLAQKLDLHVVGVYRAFPPTDPLSELVVTTAAVPRPVPPPDFWLSKVAPARNPVTVAASLRRRPDLQAFSVTVIADRVRVQQRSLTALNLDGLSRIESLSAAATAAVGIAVLGAFLVLERRRDFAVMETTGATTRQIVAGPALEGSIAVLGSLVIGLPVGLGTSVLAVRVLGLFFTLPPPLLEIPVGSLAVLVSAVIGASALSLTVALGAVTRVRAATVLREP